MQSGPKTLRTSSYDEVRKTQVFPSFFSALNHFVISSGAGISSRAKGKAARTGHGPKRGPLASRPPQTPPPESGVRDLKVFVKLFSKSLRLVRRSLTALKATQSVAKEKLGKQGVLVPSGDRSGPVYVATSVGAGRLPLADSTRGGSRETAPPFPAAKTARLEGQNP